MLPETLPEMLSETLPETIPETRFRDQSSYPKLETRSPRPETCSYFSGKTGNGTTLTRATGFRQPKILPTTRNPKHLELDTRKQKLAMEPLLRESAEQQVSENPKAYLKPKTQNSESGNGTIPHHPNPFTTTYSSPRAPTLTPESCI